MNTFEATVSHINNCQNLNVVNFTFESFNLSMMSLELNPKIKVGTKVLLRVKASHIAIAKNFSGELSFSNLLEAKIVHIDKGEVLSSIKLSCQNNIFTSIITTQSLNKMNLCKNDEVSAIIQASELYIEEIL